MHFLKGNIMKRMKKRLSDTYYIGKQIFRKEKRTKNTTTIHPRETLRNNVFNFLRELNLSLCKKPNKKSI